MSYLLVLALILLGGVFAAAEIALVSLRPSQIDTLSDRRGGARLARLAADPTRFLATVQVGVTLAGFLSAAFGAATLADPLAHLLARHGFSTGVARTISLLVVTLMISYVSLVLGELAPKRFALERAEGISLLMAGPLDRLAALFRPVIWLLTQSTNLVVRLLGGNPRATGAVITEEELRSLVTAHEALSGEERRMIDQVFAAADRPIREVMTPRTEVDFLEAQLPVTRALRLALDAPLSRYPVIGKHADDVIGFVHIRDLMKAGQPRATVGDVTREVKQLPGSKRVLAALSEMRREGQQLAIVVDEYGGTDGIVTLEDLIEEVTGDIRDEYDPLTPTAQLPAGEYDVDGLANLDDFASQTGIRLPDGPYETCAGWLMWRLGRLPAVGDTIEVEGLRVIVAELDGRRAARFRVTEVTEREPEQSADTSPELNS